MFGGAHPVTNNKRALSLLEILIRKPGSTQITDVFKEYADQARQNPEGQTSMFGAPKTPTEIFTEVAAKFLPKPKKESQGSLLLSDARFVLFGHGEDFDALKKSWGNLSKAGPYIGPRGGKWEDEAHTIPWKEDGGSMETTGESSKKKTSKAQIDKVEGKISISEHGRVFETGRPVTFTFSRNLEPSPKSKHNTEDRFQQKVEPVGRYVSIVSENTKPLPGGMVGTITFNNPIVMKINTGSDNGVYDENSWKMNLSRAFGGKKGKPLSIAIAKAGFDGIVTVDKYGTSETVDLRFLHTGIIEKSLLANIAAESGQKKKRLLSG
jgi:hypothetical protein